MKKYCLLLIAAAAVSVCACNATKEKLGFVRKGPDETSVKTNNPLILPPEYDVRPKNSKQTTAEAEDLFDE